MNKVQHVEPPGGLMRVLKQLLHAASDAWERLVLCPPQPDRSLLKGWRRLI